jgi:hypothetical protein
MRAHASPFGTSLEIPQSASSMSRSSIIENLLCDVLYQKELAQSYSQLG